MSSSLTIPKDPVYPASMDWQLLRREGIRHIERLGSDIWTDYNIHDPGITTLEILCYAITDLGYRSNFDPASLFAENGNKAFFKAAEILSCGPVTALDIRKILVDIPGVQNAWVEQQEDADIRFWFGNTITSTLLTSSMDKYLKVLGLYPNDISDIPLKLDSSLIANIYKCQDSQDLDKAKAAFRQYLLDQIANTISNDNLLKVFLLYMADHFLPESIYFLEDQIFAAAKISDAKKTVLTLISNELRQLNVSLSIDPFFYDWTKKLIPGDSLSDLLTLVRDYPEIPVFLCEEPLLCLLLAGNLKIAAMPGETIPNDWYNLFIPQGVYSVSLKLDADKAGEENDIINEALRRLHAHRNLDEDFHPKVHILEKIGIGIDLAVELDTDMDTLEILTNVFRAVQEYLSPEIKFYSLEQMRNRYAVFEIDQDVLDLLTEAQVPDHVVQALTSLVGKQKIGDTAFQSAIAEVLQPLELEDFYDDIFINAKKTYDSDQVFKGPLLQHGFIAEEELVLAQPKQTIFRSDLFQLISGIDGVLEIDRIEIFKCDDPENRTGNWCLQFDCRCLPELEFDCSYFSIVSHGIDLPVDQTKLREYMDSHPVSSTKLNRMGMMDLEVPKGKPITNLEDYTSTQIDFPRTYKIGNTGIDKKLPDLRQGQAKQLQDFLFFFDQLLANYLAQLSSVKEIFSIHPGEYIRYQTLYNIPGMQDILLDFQPETSWDDFKADNNNPYVKVLALLSEGNETDQKLFNDQILDHMLARFGEKFSDFATQLYKIELPLESADVWESGEGLDEEILDKKRFLSQIPELGSRRARGFYYHFDQHHVPRYWKTKNVEGVKRRVCAILGMKDSSRDTITCEPSFVVESGPVRNIGSTNSGRTKNEYYIKPSADSNVRLLVSVTKFSSPETALQASIDFLNMAVDKNGYGIVNDNIVGFWSGIAVNDRTTDNAIMLEPKENPDQVEQRLKYLLDLASGNCEDDGFHLLEHILLRPRSDAYTAVLTPMLCCLDDIEMLDPYSFWVTIVMPDWAGRFNDLKRRETFMQTVRKEMPAHLATRFCLLSRESMFRFEKLYHDWLEQLCSETQANLPKATDDLVNLMNSWDESIIYNL